MDKRLRQAIETWRRTGLVIEALRECFVMIAGGTDRLMDHVRRAKMRNIFATQLDEPNPKERGKSFIKLHDVTYCAVRITITKIDERVEKQILIHAYTLDGIDKESIVL